MPSLGADMERGTVLEWRVKPGDMVRRGDIIAVVQTEKSDIEVEVFTPGVVDELVVAPGEEVAVGAVLARLHAPDASPVASPVDRTRPAARPPAGAPPRATTGGPRPRPPSAPTGRRPKVVSPMVRHLADVEHVDLTQVTGSGLGGVITRTDVEDAAHRAEQRPTDAARREPAARPRRTRRVGSPLPGADGRGASRTGTSRRHRRPDRPGPACLPPRPSSRPRVGRRPRHRPRHRP